MGDGESVESDVEEKEGSGHFESDIEEKEESEHFARCQRCAREDSYSLQCYAAHCPFAAAAAASAAAPLAAAVAARLAFFSLECRGIHCHCS